jgi:soluble lytic murein transglycosylase-like protein
VREVRRSHRTLSHKVKHIKSYRKKQLITIAWLAALKHKLNPSLFIAQIHRESQFNSHARSKAGAVGVAQIMPATARAWHVNPHDPQAALNAAAKNMAAFVKTHKRQGHDQRTAEKLALIDYNCGTACKHKNNKETREYIRVITSAAYD